MWTTLPLMFALAFLPPHGASAAAQDDPNARPYHRGIVAQLSRRTVKGRVLTSPATPAARIEFDKKFKYVGSQDFILYGVARAEQHFFVEADESGRVRRLYWVQFEGYLPDNTHTYDYESAKTVRLGPFDFFADLLALNIKNNPSRPDSDGARAQSFLESKGFRMAGDEVLMQRLVHLVDDKKRDELLIIYLEDLSLLNLTAADLAKGGRAAERWPQVSQDLLARATRGLKITR